MKTNSFNLMAITGFIAINAGILLPANADTLTTVTTTTTEAPVSSYSYRRVIAPVSVSSYQKNVTIQRSAVVKHGTYHTSCTSSHHVSSIKHTRHIASTTRPRSIASTSTTKTITRIIEKPVYVDRVVERPVYNDRVVEKRVVIEKPVVVRQSYINAPMAPVYIKEKVEHHSDHDTIKIKQYY
jgi:hypothetical protein